MVPSPLKNPALKQAFGELVRFTELHPFWDAKLFKAAHAGALTKDDFKVCGLLFVASECGALNKCLIVWGRVRCAVFL